MTHKYLFIQTFILIVICQSSASIEQHQVLKAGQALGQMGFENVLLFAPSDEDLAIQYENRVFANEVYAAGVVLGIIANYISGPLNLILLPQNRGLSIGGLVVPLEKYNLFMQFAIEDTSFVAELKYIAKPIKYKEGEIIYKGSQSFQHIDIIVHPNIALQLGNFDNPYKINFNIIPEMNVSLWRGANIETRVTIPIHDEIGIYTKEARLSRFIIGQTVELMPTGWLRMRGGIFDPDRWGLSAEVARLIYESKIFIGLNGEYTGFFLHQNKTIHYSSLSSLSGKIYAHYFFPKWDMTIGCSYAKYLYGEHGPLIEISRKFTDLEIGFFAAATNVDQFAGINLKVPFFPTRHFRPRRVRIHWPFYYQWNFQSTSETQTVGETIQTGVYVQSGPDLKEFFKQFTFSYVKNNISLWKRANRFVQDRGHE